MAGISAAELAKINSFPKLVDLLRNHLEWPIEEDYGFEDVVYEYEASELGLKPDEIAKIREIHQLRPLATSQPWGIFFISFEDKALSVTVLRRILKNLILKKRAGTQASDRQAWEKNDLIFAANFGNSGSRELAFVHFSDGAQSRDLPVMKVLGWNAKDTQLHNDYVGRTLTEKLRWPDDTKDLKKWREDWSSAFELRLNETIRTSKDLALRLAGLATEIRARANELLAVETDRGPMRTMLEAFRKNLIHDLDKDGFADMFAQTIAYGMLAARISRPAGIVADNLADMVPKTNPFLKELFANFLAIGGHDKRQSLDFDELGVRDVVDMLNTANIEAVLRDFGDRNPKEDPVIHFYELFLKEYDPQKRMQRGVFYTPRPVVNFIVRGVDEILRTEFGLPLGLADISTWAEVASRNDRITIPAHVKPDTPFVQILDPATGTGTFLVEVIDLIHKRMHEHWKEQGKSAPEIKAAWNAYVPAHLLPRLTAFELMMAPYTIAHMKVGLKLSETGYTFESDERARIFLTNALEPAIDIATSFDFITAALAHEMRAANAAKSHFAATVVVGNPPYSKSSGNRSPSAEALVSHYKSAVIEETNIQPLSDDYIKFIAFCDKISSSDASVIGLITNRGYISGLIHRGMREYFLQRFEMVRVVDLHGDSNVGENVPPGVLNENVFDIMQGVAISFLTRFGHIKQHCEVEYSELWGSREDKFDSLLADRLAASSRLLPSKPYFFFLPKELDFDDEMMSWPRVDELFSVQGMGVKSRRDSFLIDIDRDTLRKRMKRLHDADDVEALRGELGVSDNPQWRLGDFQALLRKEGVEKCIVPILYRPFDTRFIWYHPRAIERGDARWPVMRNLVNGGISLLTSRQSVSGPFTSAFVASGLSEMKTAESTRGSYAFPLLLSPLNLAGETVSPTSNFDLRRMSQPIKGESAEKLFAYIYAVLHSPQYRERYSKYLEIEFPKVPFPKHLTAFAEVARIGSILVALHLLRPEDAPILKAPDIRFAGTGEARVERGYPAYKNGRVMINAGRWFEDVPKTTWDFHVGGYQVCEKWLKDRAGKGGKNPGPGRVLTEEDILHYRRIVVALTETHRLMAEIDVEIDKHGGWPDAFVTGAGRN